MVFSQYKVNAILISQMLNNNIVKHNMLECEKRIQKYQFNLKKLLGQGSYASVYRGKVIQTGEPVAVKVIDKRIFANSYNLKNIQSQIQIMKKVFHPNIVRLHDVYQTSNNMYIITEQCDIDLYHYLQHQRKLTEEKSIGFLKQIMKGVKYLNAAGIIHRDLKPANILLKGDQVKISDFGFAKNLQDDNTIMKSIVGTPLYMSPQLLKKLKYTNKSDLWSIGLIFYQMLHGKTPWPVNTEIQLINAIYSTKVTYSKSISQKSRDFISKCLQINEGERMSWDEAFQHPLIQDGDAFLDHSAHSSINLFKTKKNFQHNGIQNVSKLLNRNQNYSTTFKPDKTIDKKQLENRSCLVYPNSNKENNGKKLNILTAQQLADKRRECISFTPKLNKNVSEVRLKKIQALTPKSNGVINHRLKQVFAFNTQNPQKQPEIDTQAQFHSFIRDENGRDRPIRRKRNITLDIDFKQYDNINLN